MSANIIPAQTLLQRLKPQLSNALPKHLSADRMIRVAVTELRKIPKLGQCDPVSFCGAIMMCAQLGLEPGGALGHIYLIPFGNQVQVILGYRGMIELARRSGQIISIYAHEVYENDTFEFEYGLQEKLRHVPCRKERGELTDVYAVAHFVGGGHQMELMSKGEVDKIRSRSKSGNSGPWVTDYNEMAKKTVLRRLFKLLPVAIEIQHVAGMDEAADRGEQNLREVIENDASFDAETGEVLESAKEQADLLIDKIAG